MARKKRKEKKQERELVGVTYDRVTGRAVCWNCGFARPRVVKTLPWDGEKGKETRLRYHICQNCGKHMKSIEENQPAEVAA